MKVTVFKLRGFTMLSPVWCVCFEMRGKDKGRGQERELAGDEGFGTCASTVESTYTHLAQRPIENYIFDTHVRL